ncbi:Capsular polysaccharide biosynthesis protein WcbQ [Cupriavidus sp. U2]|uniref:LTA synthase family protein n=1 Tax=Cupriavidus sp. U2 TaxID=2920269 RepID=UPI00129D79DE|nr:LTA synthase family protein [Cupriavidus sp. U2]KAI3590494.1 Capsular polysaccharide biosynthesis protein WcbQ [Cupriavidus sp. U2]
MSGYICFLLAIVTSFVPDAIVLPRPRAPWRRGIRALGIHCLSVTSLFSLTLLCTARPAFASLVAVALVALLSVVSNAKFASLREPFVFTDLSLFSQLFRHPRLYLPFLSATDVIAMLVGTGLFVGVFLANSELPGMPAIALLAVSAACLAGCMMLSAALPLTLDPSNDQQHHGFFAVFVAYLLNGLRPSVVRNFRAALLTGPYSRQAAPAKRPDVILIQSESFFDARRLGDSVHPELLQHFDAAQRSALQYGELRVPAWGANTMRTEFAVLTGLPESMLGLARFYPYAFIRRPCASLAGWFRRAAYRTVAVHPYYADFFGRNRTLPLMHFERFLDIRHFADAKRAGPYISDAAVANAILAELEAAASEPAFIMAMTMENHGPLHLEQVTPGEGAQYHTRGDGTPWNDLTAYLRHLAAADAMIGRLMEALRARERGTILCFYGDHVPALPKVFEALGGLQTHSDYFIWSSDSRQNPAPVRKDIYAAELGQELIGHIPQEENARPQEQTISTN